MGCARSVLLKARISDEICCPGFDAHLGLLYSDTFPISHEVEHHSHDV